MKTLTGTLSFLNLKPLLLSLFLNAIFDFWIFLLIFLILYCKIPVIVPSGYKPPRL